MGGFPSAMMLCLFTGRSILSLNHGEDVVSSWHLYPIIWLSTIQTIVQVSIESRVCLLVEGGQMVFFEQ